MATKIAEAFVEISTRASGVASGLRQTEDLVRSTLGRIAAFANTTFGATIGGLFAFEAARRAATFAIQNASQQEAGEAALRGALRATGQEVNASIGRYNKFAAEIQRTTTVADDQVLAMLRIGTALGRLSGSDLEEATRASIGLARVLGTDVESAMTLVAKAAQGNTATLARYGLVINENATAAEKFQQVLDFGRRGLAQEDEAVTTLAGSWRRLGNSIGDASESLGFFLSLPLIGAQAAIDFATGAGAERDFQRRQDVGNAVLRQGRADNARQVQDILDSNRQIASRAAAQAEADRLARLARRATEADIQERGRANRFALDESQRETRSLQDVIARREQQARQIEENVRLLELSTAASSLEADGKTEAAQGLRRYIERTRFLSEQTNLLAEQVRAGVLTQEQANELRGQLEQVAERIDAQAAERDRDERTRALRDAARSAQFLGVVGEASFGGTQALDAAKTTAQETKRTADLLEDIRRNPAAAIFA